jgi:hypothetical protein
MSFPADAASNPAHAMIVVEAGGIHWTCAVGFFCPDAAAAQVIA